MKMAHNAIRVPPVVPGSDPALAGIEQRIQAERGRISLLYQVLLNSPPIAAGWEQLLTAVRNRSQLPADLRELLILRVAVLNGADYEFDAHVPHARAAGVDDARLEAVRAATIGDVFTPLQRLVLELTDAMTREVQVDDALMRRVQQQFDARGTVELVTAIAAYNMVSRLLVALHVGH